MFAQIKRPKIDLSDIKVDKGNRNTKTGNSIAGLRDQVENLAKPAKIDTNVSINKKKGIRINL